MSKTVKLPNRKNYEIEDGAKNMVHVYCTMKQGAELEEPVVDKFPVKFWEINQSKIPGYAGEVVYSPEDEKSKSKTKKSTEDGSENS